MPQRISGRLRSPACGCAGSIASAASRWRLRSAGAPSAQSAKAMPVSQAGSSTRRACVPIRTRAGAPAGRPRSRRSPRPATQAPLETSRDQERVRQDAEGLRNPVTAVVKGDQDLSASGEGGPLSRCGRGRVRAVQQDHRERSITLRAPRERHRRTTPPRTPPRVGWGRWASAPRSSVRWAVAVHIRFARWRGVRLAGRLRVPVPVTIGLGRDQRRCTHERENAIEICRSPEDVFGYLTRHRQGGRVEPEDQAGREAHAGPDRPRHPVRCGVDQGQPGNRRSTSGSSGRWRGRPSLVPGAWMRRARGGSRRRNRASGSWSEPDSGPRDCSPCCCR